ncbi:hypothetical protein HELRODRAFT_165383 [Helobdella robusta]|uniref:Endonuclease/exonuclease/phosphatase domain-containing protein n=1 Tax=Helobdella robusta TaxID=6412 RepID=T1EWP3_HELRO|nr:hypothetical protein HELRODRAFT_165383 [Helobdella robusta]ESN91357.1 hypothetical protein HELRODRAFT_165383 [Helobdella robusta]
MEIVVMLEKRMVDICFLHETRWKTNGVSLIGSYKLFWNGQKTVQNGVRIFIRESLAQNVLEVTGESEDAKNDFWNKLSNAVKKTPSPKIPLICGDLNAYNAYV